MKKLFVLALALTSLSAFAADYRCEISVLKLTGGAVYSTIEKVNFKASRGDKEIVFKKVPTKALISFDENSSEGYTFGSMHIYDKNVSTKTTNWNASYNVLIRNTGTMFSLYGEGKDKVRYVLDCMP